MQIICHQRDGWNEGITIAAEGLPPGVHAVPTSLFSENQCGFVVWADENAAEFTGPIKLIATAKRGEERALILVLEAVVEPRLHATRYPFTPSDKRATG